MIGNVYLESVKRKKDKGTTAGYDYDKVLNLERTRLNALKSDRRNAYISYTEGKLSREEYMEMSGSFNKQIQNAEQQIAEMEEKRARESLELVEKQNIAKEVEAHFFLEEYDSEKLGQVIDAIYVANDGTVEISFKQDDILKEVGVA